MTANLDLLDTLRSHGITLTVNDGGLIAKPAANVTAQLVSMIRERKPQLVSVLQGGVVRCEQCGGRVVRDRTFDGYWNRFCVDCGRWFRCEKEYANADAERRDNQAIRGDEVSHQTVAASE